MSRVRIYLGLTLSERSLLRYVVLGFGVLVVVIVGVAIAVFVLTAKEFGDESPEQRAVSGLGATISNLVPKGSVTARGDTSLGMVQQIRFRLTNVSAKESVVLDPADTLVTYIDKTHRVRLEYAPVGNAAPHWSHSWVVGDGDGVEPGDLVEFTLDVSSLDPPLEAGATFKIEIIPSDGPVATVGRTIPTEITRIMDMG